MIELANQVIACCRELAAFTEEPGRLTRRFLSPAMRDVHRVLSAWMQRAGMRVWVDDAGNLRGLHGRAARRLVIGSHLDTVPNAGAYDGILGVVMGIALVEALGNRCPGLFIEVIGFSEEEGVRFGIPFIGSRAVTGTLSGDVLDAGVRDAIAEFGLHPEDLAAARLSPEAIAYLEFHIEQGPVLESLGLPIGVVDAIVGQSRLMFTFSGHANHAGTTPMPLRQDALTAAAEWICCIEKHAAGLPGLVATAGHIQAEPNATNVIPGRVVVSLDVRHASDEIRHGAVEELGRAACDIGERRRVGVRFERRLDQPAVAMDASLGRAFGPDLHHMVSGAGHDAMILAGHIPSTMLFVRSPGGISHHPDETVLVGDVAAALETGLRFIENLEAGIV